MVSHESKVSEKNWSLVKKPYRGCRIRTRVESVLVLHRKTRRAAACAKKTRQLIKASIAHGRGLCDQQRAMTAGTVNVAMVGDTKAGVASDRTFLPPPSLHFSFLLVPESGTHTSRQPETQHPVRLSCGRLSERRDRVRIPVARPDPKLRAGELG